MERMPNGQNAWVPSEKLRDYLLAEDHPTGGSKARFFRELGYDSGNADALERCLLTVARDGTLVARAESPYGTKYVVQGYVHARGGGAAKRVTTVWVAEAEGPRPRLVTAYPG